MTTGSLESRLQGVFDRFMQRRNLFGGTVRLEAEDGSLQWEAVAGDFQRGDRYFIASTTKLYVTAVLLALRFRGELELEDRLVDHLPEGVVKGIHVRDGEDASTELTIRHLMAHTSGLPDYFQQKRPGGFSLHKDVTSGRDQSWTFDEVLAATRTMKPVFPLGTPNKAFYSDTNYQLLGKVIESVADRPLEETLQEIIYGPLALTQTYLYTDPTDDRPHHLWFKNRPAVIPRAMTSFGPDGGLVSTASESMTFLRAFFAGSLFPVHYLSELYSWNRIFFPLQYGVGVMRFKLPRYLSPFQTPPELIGHSGLSGAFAFHDAEASLYCTGTVNQIAQPGSSFRLLVRLLDQV